MTEGQECKRVSVTLIRVSAHKPLRLELISILELLLQLANILECVDEKGPSWYFVAA